MMLKGETLQKVLDALREVPGYFVIRDTAGREFVVARKEDFISGGNQEKQLPLPTTSSLAAAVRETAQRLDRTPEFILDSINREIADYHEEEREKEIDDLSVSFSGSKRGKHIHFEPITGDLPPELQE